jgi:hypothetical protein
MRHSEYKITKETRRSKADVRQRLRYGVSTVDTWGFDGYLLNVLANGLAILARDAHGWPSNERFPEFEDWTKALQQASDDAYWCLVTYDELTMQAFDKYYGELHRRTLHSIEDFFKEDISEELRKEYRAVHARLDNERNMRKDRLLDFVKENFFHLWD